MPEQESEFGDFAEIKDESKPEEHPQEEQEKFTRVVKPKKGQLIGLVTQRLGGNRMSVKCTDQKVRNCRVPGRFKRRFWLRPGDAVIIEPWPDDNNKADIVFQYKKGARFQLNKTGILDKIKDEF